jgi:hypothetical protein
MNPQKESELFNEMAKLNRGTRRRLLRRTTKKYKDSLKQWQNQEGYHKTVELWKKINLIKQMTIWFDEDQASKFDKKQLSTSYVP